MIRIENSRADGLNDSHALLNCHCIWLVDREEGNIYILEGKYIIVVLGISCDIDSRTAYCEDISCISALLRMEIQVSFRFGECTQVPL